MLPHFSATSLYLQNLRNQTAARQKALLCIVLPERKQRKWDGCRGLGRTGVMLYWSLCRHLHMAALPLALSISSFRHRGCFLPSLLTSRLFMTRTGLKHLPTNPLLPSFPIRCSVRRTAKP